MFLDQPSNDPILTFRKILRKKPIFLSLGREYKLISLYRFKRYTTGRKTSPFPFPFSSIDETDECEEEICSRETEKEFSFTIVKEETREGMTFTTAISRPFPSLIFIIPVTVFETIWIDTLFEKLSSRNEEGGRRRSMIVPTCMLGRWWRRCK